MLAYQQIGPEHHNHVREAFVFQFTALTGKVKPGPEALPEEPPTELSEVPRDTSSEAGADR